MSETFQPGDRVTWHKVFRGGYGYSARYGATVVKVNGERATIKADHLDRLRSVKVVNLKPRIDKERKE